MNIFREILRAQDEKKDFAVVTIVKAEGSTPRSANAKMLVFSDGKSIGTVGGGELEARAMREALSAIKKGCSTLLEYRLDDGKEEGLSMKCGGDVTLHIEIHKAKPRLFIIGAGHVGRALCSIASMLDFDITIIDDRDEWANEDRFPTASNILVKEDMSRALDGIEVGEEDYIVIATRGHSYDKEALSNALTKRARYVGMIGSQKKVEEIFRQLIEEGVGEELLKRVRSPIGLDLGGETPEEIAVSIAAEILTVKYCRSGSPLSCGRNEI